MEPVAGPPASATGLRWIDKITVLVLSFAGEGQVPVACAVMVKVTVPFMASFAPGA